jgi:hypothetical protein
MPEFPEVLLTPEEVADPGYVRPWSGESILQWCEPGKHKDGAFGENDCPTDKTSQSNANVKASQQPEESIGKREDEQPSSRTP